MLTSQNVKSGERLCVWKNTTKEAPRLAQTPHSEFHRTNIDAFVQLKYSAYHFNAIGPDYL